MIELPKKCLVNKFIPKKIFYEKMGVSNSIKNDFIDKIERITWLYKLSEDTIGITKTSSIEEIEIFQIDLKEKIIPNTIIKTITKGIPYRILFILKYNDEYCYAIRLEDIYLSEWNENLEFNFNAINLEIVFEEMVKTIINEQENKKDFESIILNKSKIENLNKEIEKLSLKVKNEKQFDRKVELNNDLNKLKNELEELNHGAN